MSDSKKLSKTIKNNPIASASSFSQQEKVVDGMEWVVGKIRKKYKKLFKKYLSKEPAQTFLAECIR